MTGYEEKNMVTIKISYCKKKQSKDEIWHRLPKNRYLRNNCRNTPKFFKAIFKN